jgi:hypothetical protein
VIVTDPAPVSLTVLPLIVAGPLARYITGSPLDAVALSVKSASPKVLLESAPKLIVWEDFATVKVRLTAEAGA